MTPPEALAFIRKHGIVLESARGVIPSLAEQIAGEPIRGSWWVHPRSHDIWKVTRAVRDSPEVLVCRLVAGKITFVHERVWPALVRVAGRIPRNRLAQVREVHTASGQHSTKETPFPRWVPAEVSRSSKSLSEERALAQLSPWSP